MGRSRFRSAIALLAAVVMLSACGRVGGGADSAPPPATTEAPQQKPAEPKEPITLQFFSHRFTEVPYGDILRKQIKEYEQLNPHITVEPVESPTGQRQTKFASMVMGGSPPDLAFADRSGAIYWYQGLLMDLEPFIQQEGGDSFKARFPAHAAAAVSDGKTHNWYAIPAETQLWSLVVDVERAREVGVQIPKDGIWTWDEYMAAAREFNRDTDGDGKTDQFAYVNYGSGSADAAAIVVGNWMLANGGTYWGFNQDCTQVNLMTAENIEAFKHYVSMGLEGYQPPGYVERGGGDHYRAIANRTAVTAVTHPGGVANSITLSEGKLKALQPVFLPGAAPKVGMYVEAWAIPKGSRHPEEAWKLLNWLNSDDKAVERTRVQGTLPASKTALERVRKEVPEQAAWVNMIGNDTVAVCAEVLPRAAEIKRLASDAITRAYQGENPEAVLRDLEVQLAKAIAE